MNRQPLPQQPTMANQTQMQSPQWNSYQHQQQQPQQQSQQRTFIRPQSIGKDYPMPTENKPTMINNQQQQMQQLVTNRQPMQGQQILVQTNTPQQMGPKAGSIAQQVYKNN